MHINRLCIDLALVPCLHHKRKYNALELDKCKASNLLKMLKGEHPTKKWQNCGTEVLWVMLFYDGAELTRIVNKVLGKYSSLLDQSLVNNHYCFTKPVKLHFF